MILSHKYKFIFIKNQKVAGTSVEVFLSQHCGQQDIVTPIQPPVPPHAARNYHWNGMPFPENPADPKMLKFYNHMSALEVQRRIPRQLWESCFKFCVERNPWDKTVSHFHQINHLRGGDWSFEQYLDKGRFCSDFSRYSAAGGTLLVDRVVRYEFLEEELGQVFERLGVPFDGSLGVRAKSEYRSDRRHYRDFYSPSSRAAVAEAFAREIDLLGYEF